MSTVYAVLHDRTGTNEPHTDDDKLKLLANSGTTWHTITSHLDKFDQRQSSLAVVLSTAHEVSTVIHLAVRLDRSSNNQLSIN